MEDEKKNYYFIVAGEITFMNTDGDIGMTKMNTVIGHETPNVPLKLIGKANQALIMSLVEELKDPTINVLKIVTVSISPMGQMTAAEFYDGVGQADPEREDQLMNREKLMRAMGIPEASPAADACAAPSPGEETTPLAVTLVAAGANMINKRASDRDVEQERSMADIVKTFNAFSGHNLTETEGWAFMVILKLIRSKRGHFKADDFIDMASYAGLMGESRFIADNAPGTASFPS